MFVAPKTGQKKPSATNEPIQKGGISSSVQIVFGIMAILAVSAMHFQGVESSGDSEFTAHAVSEVDEFTLLEEREEGRLHFTTDTSNIVPMRSGSYELLEEREIAKKHFTTNTDNIIPLNGDSRILLEEREGLRIHFQYGL